MYGSLEKINTNGHSLIVGERNIRFFSEEKINSVLWDEHSVDIVIDSSGIMQNVIDSHKIIDGNVKKVIITHSPKSHIDKTIIFGANEKSYNPNKHHIINSSLRC